MSRELKEEKIEIQDNQGKMHIIFLQFIEQTKGSVLFVAWDEKGNAINAGRSRSKEEILQNLRNEISNPENLQQTSQRLNYNRKQSRPYDSNRYPGE